MVTRFESSVTAVSWIPSEAISGPVEDPVRARRHPLRRAAAGPLESLEELRTSDRFREANELRAFIEVEDGRIVGMRPPRPGPYRRDDRPRRACGNSLSGGPAAGHPGGARGRPTSVRFVQTIGGRMGLPTPRPIPHKPFVQFWPSIAWTTLALTINADGSSSHELVGASPFPRHWVYDHEGRLVEKSGVIDFGRGSTTRSATGRRGARRTRRPSSPRSSRPSSAPCRARSCAAARSRRSGRSPRARPSSSRETPGPTSS